MKTDDALKRIITFLILTLLLSAIFWALIFQAGGTQAFGGAYTLGLMWCPGIAALVTTFVFQRNLRELGWSLGKLRYLLLAYALPLAYAGVPYILVWMVGLGQFTTQNVPPGQPLVVFVLVNATIVFLLGGVLSALGEEIGWRGLLVPQLARLTSFTWVSLISGAIWTLWHVPLLLFSDYTSGAPAWYALACFAVLVVGISFAFAWLRLKSGSLWTAAILHGSHNLFIQGVLDPLTRGTDITKYITGEFGIGLALAAILVAFVFWRFRDSLHTSPSASQIPEALVANA